MIKIHNAETNEVIEREMNDAEFAQYEADQAEKTARTTAEAEKASAKASAKAKLSALGLTEEEITALTN